jgi:hypothetical protein
MPKKKLTKAQVKRELAKANGALYALLLDKLGHADSRVPISAEKILTTAKFVKNAFLRVK